MVKAIFTIEVEFDEDTFQKTHFSVKNDGGQLSAIQIDRIFDTLFNPDFVWRNRNGYTDEEGW